MLTYQAPPERCRRSLGPDGRSPQPPLEHHRRPETPGGSSRPGHGKVRANGPASRTVPTMSSVLLLVLTMLVLTWASALRTTLPPPEIDPAHRRYLNRFQVHTGTRVAQSCNLEQDLVLDLDRPNAPVRLRLVDVDPNTTPELLDGAAIASISPVPGGTLVQLQRDTEAVAPIRCRTVIYA
jgi:hypothetical protein